MVKKFFVMFIAILLMGFALSFLIEVNWGLDPASFCNKSVSKYIGLSLGTWQIIVYAFMLIIVIIFDRKLIGLGTIVNMVLIGYTADFCCFLWEKFIARSVFESASFLPLKTIIFIISVALFVLFAAIYMNAQMGLSPYDAIPIIISNKFHRFPYTAVRMAYDISAVSIGVLFCAKKNPYLLHSLPGAIVMSLSLGPAITIAGKCMKGMFTVKK